MNSDYNRISSVKGSAENQSFGNTITERVIRAVAAAKDETPVEMRPPLYDVIDPDALDTLFTSDGISVEFSWQNCQIEIDENGTIHVTEME